MVYEIIYADAPWLYRDKAAAGERGSVWDCKELSVDDLCRMPVAEHAAKNAILFHWVTWPLMLDYERIFKLMRKMVRAQPTLEINEAVLDLLLPEPIRVMKAWGFTPKACGFDWIKLSKDGVPYRNMGHYTRSNGEVCLVGKRGRGLERAAKNVMQPILTYGKLPKNEKPEEARNRIVDLYGDRPRIELFARHAVNGWSRWGDEAPEGPGHVPLETFAVEF